MSVSYRLGVKKALLLVVLCVGGLVPQQAQAGYWIENTFRRADWVKENCAKFHGKLISYEELQDRVGLPKSNSFAALELCRSYR